MYVLVKSGDRYKYISVIQALKDNDIILNAEYKIHPTLIQEMQEVNSIVSSYLFRYIIGLIYMKKYTVDVLSMLKVFEI